MKFQKTMVRCGATAVTFVLMSAASFAMPTLTVVDNGLNGSSNREWIVRVAPDTTLFDATSGQGSLSLELGFEVTTGSLVSAAHNATLWPYESGQPGNNPFTNTTTFGVATDLAGDTVFAALGSNLFSNGNAVDVMTIVTAGSAATTLEWGGHTLLSGTANQFTGSRIAQGATNYDGYTGSISSSTGLLCDLEPDTDCDLDDIDLLYATNPTTAAIATWLTQASHPSNPYKASTSDVYVLGDVNLNGDVNSSDLGLLLNNFSSTSGVGWGGGDLNADSLVNSTDLGLLLNTFGNTSAFSAAVPEPGSFGLMLLAAVGFFGNRRKIARK